MDKKLGFTTGITTSIKPSKKTLYFIQDLLEIIPNSIFYKRKNIKFKEIYFFLKNEESKIFWFL